MKEQRDEGRRHDLGSSDVDISGMVPHVTFCHSTIGELLIELSARVIQQDIHSAKSGLDFVEGFLDRVVILDVDLEWKKATGGGCKSCLGGLDRFIDFGP